MLIRELRKSDRNQIEKFVKATQNFSDDEKLIAMELIDVVLNQSQNDYYIRVAETEDKVSGYYCIGKRALTLGVFDLYWIVVEPEIVHRGIGSQLLLDAEEYVNSKNGNFIWVETSSRDDYKLTRDFYIKHNYQQILFIENFYKENDSLIVFGKHFNYRKVPQWNNGKNF